MDFKGIVHPKMKILSSFTHYQVFLNQYDFCFVFLCNGNFLLSDLHLKKVFKKACVVLH